MSELRTCMFCDAKLLPDAHPQASMCKACSTKLIHEMDAHVCEAYIALRKVVDPLAERLDHEAIKEAVRRLSKELFNGGRIDPDEAEYADEYGGVHEDEWKEAQEQCDKWNAWVGNVCPYPKGNGGGKGIDMKLYHSAFPGVAIPTPGEDR